MPRPNFNPAQRRRWKRFALGAAAGALVGGAIAAKVGFEAGRKSVGLERTRVEASVERKHVSAETRQQATKAVRDLSKTESHSKILELRKILNDDDLFVSVHNSYCSDRDSRGWLGPSAAMLEFALQANRRKMNSTTWDAVQKFLYPHRVDAKSAVEQKNGTRGIAPGGGNEPPKRAPQRNIKDGKHRKAPVQQRGNFRLPRSQI